MDRKFRQKIEKSLEVSEKTGEMEVFEKNVRLSAEKLITLLPNSVNRAKLVAQIYSGKAFDTLIALMEDETIHPEIRRKCANDLLNRGYGLPEQNIKTLNVGATIDLPPETFRVTDLSIEASRYVENGIPSSEWPLEIREYFGIN